MAEQVTLHGVSYTYRTPAAQISALRNVDLELASGTATAIVGRSGSGKSTLVSILALLRKPTAGQVRFSGVDTTVMGDTELSRVRGSAVGVVFQSFHLDSSVSALENTLLPYYFQTARRRRQAAADAMATLDLLGIADLARRRPSEMSGGQRQRVAVARALLMNPRLLVADEPTGNLDEDTAGAIAECIFAVSREFGAAVVVVTHDADIAALADRTVRLEAGRLRQEDA